MGIELKFTDNSDDVLGALIAARAQALEAIGMMAESYAKDDCPVDTGRLRNSITHAVENEEQAVYIGTNVEYGKFIELGTSRMRAKPYLKPAASHHSAEYKAIAESALKNA